MQFGFCKMTCWSCNLVFSFERTERLSPHRDLFDAFQWLATCYLMGVPFQIKEVPVQLRHLALLSFIEKSLHRDISVFLKC